MKRANESKRNVFLLVSQTEDVKEIAQALAKLPKKNGDRPRVVVITQGSDPTILAIGS